MIQSSMMDPEYAIGEDGFWVRYGEHGWIPSTQKGSDEEELSSIFNRPLV